MSIINNLDQITDGQDIAAFVRSRGWKAMKDHAITLMDSWAREIPIGDTEFDYLRNSLKRDGRVDGLREFIMRMEHLANSLQNKI
jgi:hypothetical protein